MDQGPPDQAPEVEDSARPASSMGPADEGPVIAESPRSGSDDSVIETLRSVSLFEGLDDDDLGRIRDISQPLTLEAGETLFEEGEKGETFFVIIKGGIELSKSSAKGSQKLAVLRAGQAFGEMALLNRAPRSASARAVGSTSMLTISHDAFEAMLGGQSLALGIMRGLSRALWATSVRLTTKKTLGDEAKTAVNELNRVVRGQLTARTAPVVSGYDIAAKATFHPKSRGGAAWDTFELADGRSVLALLSAQGSGMLHAQNLAVTRALMRDAAGRPHSDLGALMSGVNRSLVAVAVAGVSQPVSATVVAVSEERVEWVSAGSGIALSRIGGGDATPVQTGAPALGASPDTAYASGTTALGHGDAFVVLAEGASHVPEKAGEVLSRAAGSSASALLEDIISEVSRSDAGIEGIFDTVVAVVVRAGEAGAAGDEAVDVIEETAQPVPEAPIDAVPVEPMIVDEAVDALEEAAQPVPEASIDAVPVEPAGGDEAADAFEEATEIAAEPDPFELLPGAEATDGVEEATEAVAEDVDLTPEADDSPPVIEEGFTLEVEESPEEPEGL